MTRHTRALFFAALAVVLGPVALSDRADGRDARAIPAVASVPVEQDAYPVSYAPRTELPEPPATRLPQTSAAPATSTESPLPGPVIVSCGLAHAAFRGTKPSRPLHPSRAPPPLS